MQVSIFAIGGEENKTCIISTSLPKGSQIDTKISLILILINFPLITLNYQYTFSF